jgi:hypothetical protein
MHSRTLRLLVTSLLLAVPGLSSSLLLAGPAAAQQSSSGNPLNVKVSLELGTVSLPKVLKALEAQTGLRIQAAPYLRERRLVVEIAGTSARQALDAITSLHGWTWKQIEPGHILIERKRPKAGSGGSAVPLMVQSAIPLDWRRFLGIGKDSFQEVAQNTKLDEIIQNMKLDAVGQNTKQDAKTARQSARRQWRPNLLRKLSRASERLLKTLDPEAIHTVKLPYSKLSPEQQQSLITLFTLKAFRETNFLLLYDDYYATMLNPANISLQIRGPSSLYVGVIEEDSEGSFAFEGISVQIPPQTEGQQP